MSDHCVSTFHAACGVFCSYLMTGVTAAPYLSAYRLLETKSRSCGAA